MTTLQQIDPPHPPPERPQLVAAFYKFVRLDDIAAVKAALEPVCAAAGISGSILLAREGVNGTVSGPRAGIVRLFEWFTGHNRIGPVPAKFSFAEEPAFHRMKVRLKQEIVTMGEPDVDPAGIVGTYVKPQDWNALIRDPDTLVIDTRNDYEIGIGRFENAVDPGTRSFREFPQWVRDNLDTLPPDRRPKNIAMYCTGGIRCEKSTSYLVAKGYGNVFHLEGGILKYLETIPAEASAWQGDCYVFDRRVSVRHGLEPGGYGMCHACRLPVSEDDRKSPLYEEGVSCPNCHGTHTPDQLRAFRQRQMQVELAEKRGQAHIGGTRSGKQPKDGGA
ncbi:MAG: rhodanese-related sulfurtransferase [Beijerinckiaceae bacterium]